MVSKIILLLQLQWSLRAWLNGKFQPGLKSAEILLRLHDGLQPGLKLLALVPNMKLRVKSLRRIKIAPRTRIVKIGTMLLSQFGLLTSLNFQLFWMVTPYKMMELKRNLSLAAYLSARKMHLQRKRLLSLERLTKCKVGQTLLSHHLSQLFRHQRLLLLLHSRVSWSGSSPLRFPLHQMYLFYSSHSWLHQAFCPSHQN